MPPPAPSSFELVIRIRIKIDGIFLSLAWPILRRVQSAMMTNDDGGFDPARRSLASVPDPGGSSDNAGAGFPSNDWGGEEDQEGAEEYHDGQYYEGEDGYEYGDGGDDGGYDEEYPAPQDARSAGGGVTFDQPYESAGSTSFRRRSRNHLSKGKHKANSEPSLSGMMSCVLLTTLSSSSFLHHRSIQSL